jgi:hypothetical protein
MSDASKDAGVLQVLVERFNSQRLPRALDLKKKVDAGETLGDRDLQFLEEVFTAAHEIHSLADKHPDMQSLYANTVHLYKEILDKAMENENKAS